MFYLSLSFISLIGLVLVFWHRCCLMLRGLKWQQKHIEEKADEESEITIGEDAEIGTLNLSNKDDVKSFEKSLFDIDILIKHKNLKEAEFRLIELMSLFGENEQCQHRLAKIYLEQENFPKAKAIYEMLTHKHQNPVFFTNLGFCYFVKGELESALLSYQKALELDPSRKERFMNLARVYEQMEDKKSARRQYERWLEREPNDIDGILVLAAYFEQDNDLNGAKNMYNKILNLSPYHEIANSKVKEIAEKI